MSTYTTNYNLEKPDSTDDFKDFRSNYNSNMDIIDANLGGGGGGNVDDVLVNGVSVVDGNHDAQITSYKEVTQAEYDALPATKLTDGIAYFIKDAGGGGGGSSSHDYSTTEQVIGTWIDGKPLYEKTYKITSGITFGGSYNYVALDSAIRVKKYDGYVMRTTGAVDGFVPYVSSINASTCNYIGIRTTGIEYTVMSVFQTDFDCVCFTIQYTKTTD